MIIIKHLKRILRVALVTTLCTMQVYATTHTYVPKTCPRDNPYHILVNKQQGLSKDFVPAELVVPNVPFSFEGYHEKKLLDPTAAAALEKLFEAAQNDGITLAAVSGYRSYDRQAIIYHNYVARDGQALADTYSARPGTSEHQTGLAMDVSAPSVNYALTIALGKTTEGQWLANNAHLYGFIIRYPEGKQAITGYVYEPWHLRYVGETLAEKLFSTSLTFEELDTCCEVIPAALITPATPVHEYFQLTINTSLKRLTLMLKASASSFRQTPFIY